MKVPKRNTLPSSSSTHCTGPSDSHSTQLDTKRNACALCYHPILLAAQIHHARTSSFAAHRPQTAVFMHPAQRHAASTTHPSRSRASRLPWPLRLTDSAAYAPTDLGGRPSGDTRLTSDPTLPRRPQGHGMRSIYRFGNSTRDVSLGICLSAISGAHAVFGVFVWDDG